MNKHGFIHLILMTGVLFSQCAWAGWTRSSSSTIRFEGDIEKGSYEQYLAVARGGFTRVLLNSSGGYPSVALKIARDIQGRPDVEIDVKGVCISACASYLAIAGKRLNIECDSVVAWHGGLGKAEDEARSMRAEGIPEGLVVEYAAWLDAFHADESAFYAGASVDIALLADSEKAVNALDLKESYTLDPVTGEYSYSTSAGVWVPSMKSLRNYGVKKLKYCHDYSPDRIGEILKRNGYQVKFSTAALR
ncbi:hypothetical protein I6J77_13320 [Rhodanobacter sp. FDAARGOS 1247]|uniref:hypothetical protein n=1 Tax=Rhodanobacter sp. FDAARGOS 1247 TaxID=2778082 RepID=UPI0019519FFE|nr:hypothetical protein [Rhodanobacter sp. FDAARGOS 1247]QRP63091.1 hypothetical protein I6J77_13320 [Rhodanobacter sp. FDAARGOS 1247]